MRASNRVGGGMIGVSAGEEAGEEVSCDGDDDDDGGGTGTTGEDTSNNLE